MKFYKSLLEAKTQCISLLSNNNSQSELCWVDYKFLKSQIKKIILNNADNNNNNKSISIYLFIIRGK